MVIGNGLMAKAFSAWETRDDVCVFASGVSDSSMSVSTGPERERDLLLKTIKSHPSALLIYFSTCSIEDPSVSDRPYCAHKLAMEHIIEERSDKYLICRLSHVVGRGGNKSNIINYLIDKVRKAEHFELWANAYRNLIDVEDVVSIVDCFIENNLVNHTVSIAHPKSISISTILNLIETHLEQTADYSLVEKGAPLSISCQEMEELYPEIDRLLDPQYLPMLLEKYHYVEV